LPLYSVLFVAVGLAAETLRSIAGKTLATLFVSCFLLFSFVSNYLKRPVEALAEVRLAVNVPGEPFVHRGERVSSDHSELIAHLEKENINHVFTNYWIGYRLAFETNEEVTFSRYSVPRNLRIPSYEIISKSQRDQRTFVLVPGQADRLKKSLSRRGRSFSESQASGYVIIKEEGGISEWGEPVPASDIEFKSSVGKEFLASLNDNSPGSRWRSASPQAQGMSILAHFEDEDTVISGLRIDHGFWPHDGAQGLLVEGLGNDGSSCTLYEAQTTLERELKIHFEPQSFKALRFTQTGHHPVVDWSVAEIEIYQEQSQ